MYCNKCGREIDYASNLCLECTAELAIKAKQAREAKKAEEISSAAPVVEPAPVAKVVEEPASVAEIVEEIAPVAEIPAETVADEPVANQPVEAESVVDEPISEVCADENSVEEKIPYVEPIPVASPVPLGDSYTNALPPMPMPNTRKEGFGKALAGAIITNVTAIFVAIAVNFLTEEMLGVGIIFSIIVIAMSIISLIFGIQSIKTFKKVKRVGYPVPVATLVLGIYSLAISAYFIFYIFLVLPLSLLTY